jgi:predicted metalloprotease
MRWNLSRKSSNIEDRRGMSLGTRTGGIGCLGLLVIVVLGWLTGQNPLKLLQQVGDEQVSTETPASGPGGYDQERDFVSAVLGDTEETWTQIFAASGRQYRPPTLVLFTDGVRSACGLNSAAVGPFYCPRDQKIYLDLSFFRALDRRFGAPGDFAQAYVIAHEAGHHIQNLLGIEADLQRRRESLSEIEVNDLSVRQELQADCFAGVWGNHAGKRDLLEEGDVEEGLRAAQMIGDDLLQKRSQGYVNPESFTHGTSEQRSYWLRRGLQTGRIDQCDTIHAASIDPK